MSKKNRTYHKRGELVHGMACGEHPLYQTWADMMGRCYNPNELSFKNYGGRGITVTEKWHHFKNFAEDMHPKLEEAKHARREFLEKQTQPA